MTTTEHRCNLLENGICTTPGHLWTTIPTRERSEEELEALRALAEDEDTLIEWLVS